MTQDKRKLTNKEMVEHLKSKGVRFELTSESEAIATLRQNTYFYKVTSYRKNFPKENNLYKNLDFAMLSDLATIDMRLRYLLLQFSLDYEHAIKTKLLDIITNDPKEDGYDIVQRFKIRHPNTYKIVMDDFHKNKYNRDMYNKRKNKVAIWNAFEVISFGSLSIFIDFFWNDKGTKSIKEAKALTKYAKNIRNAAAHSNPILLNLFDKSMQKKNDQAVVSYASLFGVNSKDLRDKKINDIFSLLYLHKKYCSEGINHARVNELKSLLKRAEYHKDWYTDIECLKKFRQIIKLSLDYLEK
ncbi:Abi family protein [Lactococcus lactis]|uniref:Abi family protein n=1 Tax=Lactococcus lactis TaxID=1358 RepID=UPI001913E196|nr:Abi family protein [Lactococcus lactis]MBK5075731.1 Abi family protein [Lactococcus lactis]